MNWKERFRFRIFFYTIIGSVIGAGFIGVIESIVKTIVTDYGRWTLPAVALGHRAFVGIFAGIALGAFIIALLFFFSGRLKRRIIFAVSAATMTTYFGLFWLNSRIQDWLSISFETGEGGIQLSLIFIIVFWALFFLFSFLYRITERIFRKPLTAFIGGYVVAFVIALIIAFLSPEDTRAFRPYNPAMASKVADKPNVIFILVDALRGDWTSPYGYDIETPNMQTLADDGILFMNTFANSSWTKPSVASIFTSLLPRSHGVTGQFTHIQPDMTLLPAQMSGAGYYSVGISTNPVVQRLTGFDNGFNEFKLLKGIQPAPVDPDAPKLAFHAGLDFILTTIFPWLKKGALAYCDANRATDWAIDWMQENGDRKFFMYLHYMDPHADYYHHPYNGQSGNPAQDPSEDMYELYRELYKGEIKYTDRHLGRLIDYLKKIKLYDSSLIIFTADHGQEMFEHYGWAHGTSLFDEQIVIPLIIKLPYQKNAGEKRHELVNLIDYAPTLLNLVDIPRPAGWDGKNIFDPDYHNECVILQGDRRDFRIAGSRTFEYKWFEAADDYQRLRMQSIGFKPVDPRAVFPEHNFFDLRRDSLEKHNLYETEQYQAEIDSIKQMHADILKGMKEETQLEQGTLDPETIRRLKELGYLQ